MMLYFLFTVHTICHLIHHKRIKISFWILLFFPNVIIKNMFLGIYLTQPIRRVINSMIKSVHYTIRIHSTFQKWVDVK